MSTPPLQLRDYQAKAVDRTVEVLSNKPVLVAPTGSGKTVMGTALVHRVARPTLWLAHRKELVEQAASRLAHSGLEVGTIIAGSPRRDAPVQVASVQTLARRSLPPAELIVIDEAHHATAETYTGILAKYPDAGVAGLTATPFRLDGKGLGDVFGELVVAATTRELCEAGVLHAPRVYSSESPDLRGLSIVAGDYTPGQLATRTNRPELIADIVRTWLEKAGGRRTVVFAVNTEHSRALREAFVGAGVSAGHIDGKTGRREREETLDRLARGDLTVVCNCMVLTEGWDLPALECAVIARPTASLNLHLQMIGRVMRACHGKTGALVLDHAGNHHAHGAVTRHLDFSLTRGAPEGDSDREDLGIKRCKRCGFWFDKRLSRCPECGHCPMPEITIAMNPDAELVEFRDDDFAYRQQIWRMLEESRRINGYRDGWSIYRYQERFGVPPVLGIAGELIDPRHADQMQKRSAFEHLAAVGEAKGYQPGWAAHRFRDLFGHWPKGFVQEVRAEQIGRRWEALLQAADQARLPQVITE